MRFSNPKDLAKAVRESGLFFGIDSTTLVQECFQATIP
jgi:hypothetical protein